MATITTRRGYLILNWTDTAGKRHRQQLGLASVVPKRDADAILKAKQYELSTGAKLLNVHRRPAPRFDDWLKTYLLWHQGEYPASTYRVQQIAIDHLKPKFGSVPLNLIDPQAAEDYKTERRFLVRGSTVTKELRVLQAIINRAVDLKVISDNPVSMVQAPKSNDSKPHRFYEADELDRLYKASLSNRGAVWRLMANTGMRRAEALMLRRVWVTDTTIRVLSSEDARTKSGKWRSIPRSDGASAALVALASDGVYVLPRMQPESLSRCFAQDAERAGLDGSLHTLRHTYISHLVRAGLPLRTVQIYAGHAHITTTEKYAYLDPGAAPELATRLAI